MAAPPPAKSFVARNIVTIVMIPSLIGIHLGWLSIQKNRSLVSESEEKDLPIIEIYKYVWNRWTAGDGAKVAGTSSAAPAK